MSREQSGERHHNQAYSVPLVAISHPPDESDDDIPLAQTQRDQRDKAAEARRAADTVQSILEENIAGIGERECNPGCRGEGGGSGRKDEAITVKLTVVPPSVKSGRSRRRTRLPWYRKKVSFFTSEMC